MKPNRLAFNTSIYTIASVISIVLSFITFPIITRNLSLNDYGLLNIAVTVSGILIAVSKMGTAKSIIRFYSRNSNNSIEEKKYNTTVIVGLIITSGLICSVYMAFVVASYYFFFQPNDSDLFRLLLLISILAISSSVLSGVLNLLKASERPTLQSFFTLSQKIIAVALIYILISYYKSAEAVIIINFTAELIIILLFIIYLIYKKRIELLSYSKKLHLDMIVFGSPLIIWELSGLILTSTDKLMLSYFHGNASVAVYSAPYNLIYFIYTGIFISIVSAATPIATRLWETEGRESAEKLYQNVKIFYFLIAIPVTIGFICIGPIVIALLTDNKYSPSSLLISFLMISYFIKGYTDISTFGLYIQKKQKLLLKIIITIVFLNIIINLLLIPSYVTIGASISTLVSNLVLLILLHYYSGKYISQDIPLVVFAKSLLASVPMISIFLFSDISGWHELIRNIFYSVISYALIILFIDKNIRNIFLKNWIFNLKS